MRESFQWWIYSFVQFSTVVLALLTLTSFIKLGGYWNVLEQFRLQYAILQISLLALSLLIRNWRWVIVGVFFLGINLIFILPYYWPQLIDRSQPDVVLKLMQFNFERANYRQVAQYIQEKDPDIIAFEEYYADKNPEWRSTGVLAKYPYSYVNRSEMALYSKFPLNPFHPSQQAFRTLIAQINLRKHPITLIATHSPWPIGNDQRTALYRIAANRQHMGTSVILLGDLNSVPWAMDLKEFENQMHLRNTMLGHGIQLSWPAAREELPLPILAIDHCLVSPQFITLRRERGPNLGSDHFPLYVEVGFVKSDTNSQTSSKRKSNSR